MPTSPENDEWPDGPGLHSSTAHEASESSTESATAGEIEELREELHRAQDRHRRALADLDNYRKRVVREGDRRAAEAVQALQREWLEALDSVERALRMEPDDPGLTAVLEQMDAILARHGIERIDAVGTRFDPERHEAIAAVPAGDAPDHTVLEVARSGFVLRDGSVLRPAQVVVSQRTAGEH